MAGKVLVITGAGGGLGSLIASAEAGNFSEIALVGRRHESLSASAKRAGKAGTAKFHILPCDVTDENGLRDALSPFEAIDGLVNAAAVLGPVARFAECEFGAWKRAVEIDLIGSAAACRFALPGLLKSRRGKIVNFSGGGAAGARGWHSAYAASKAAIVRLTETLAEEYPSLDINAIAPGAHKTGIWESETHDKKPEKWADRGRFCSTVSFLLSGKSDGISGKLIHIYDKWEAFSQKITGSDIYTLRRIEHVSKKRG